MTSDILNSIWPEWHVFSDPIGRGTYGFVYEAVRNDHSVTSRAAIKVISIPPNPGEIDSLRSDGYSENATRTYLQNIVNDFVKEIQLMESFKGVQNIVSVEDYKVVEKENEIGWNIYIRMELLTPLNTYTCDKTLSEEEVMKLGQDICTALALCAKRNVIHRDIKPENIFINEFGDFKLGDFGIARSLENFTGSLSRKGTPNYIAPEIEKGLSYDATADLYSLGLVLYKFMNKNRLPFLDVERQLPNPNENVAAIRRRINGEPLPPPCNASKEFSDIILRACAYDPHQRFASAEDMREEIALCLINNVYKKSTDNIDQTISACQPPQEQFKRRPLNTEKIPLSDRVIGKFGVQKKNKKPFLIGVGVSAAVLLFCGLFSLAKILDSNKELSTSGNNISTSDSYVKTVEEKNNTAAKTDSFVTDDIHTMKEETTITAAEEQHTTTEVKNTTTTENVNTAENIITTTNIDASTNEKITYLMDACNSFDLDYATEYSEKVNINGESFYMAGAGYRNGVVLNNNRGSTQTVSITYNVLGDYSTVSFYLGHLDETEMNPIELNIFLDNVFYKKINLEANDIPKYVEVDVSNKSTLRFTADLGNRTGYCLANLAVDVSSEDIAPIPNILESNSKYAVDRLYSYDYSYAAEYSEKLNTNGESFCMAGAGYRNGVVLNNNRGSTQTVSITYNVLGDYSTVSFYLGHLDETEMNPIELNIFLDNVFYKKINLEANDIPKYVEVDVSNKSTLRFTADLGNRTGYCLAEMTIT